MAGTIYQSCPECGTDREQAVCVNCHFCSEHCTCKPAQQAPTTQAPIRVRWEDARKNFMGQTVQFGEIMKSGFFSGVVAQIIDGAWAVGKQTMTYDNDAAGFRNDVMASGTADSMEAALAEVEAYVATLK